jgi:hypothetical protein
LAGRQAIRVLRAGHCLIRLREPKSEAPKACRYVRAVDGDHIVLPEYTIDLRPIDGLNRDHMHRVGCYISESELVNDVPLVVRTAHWDNRRCRNRPYER